MEPPIPAEGNPIAPGKTKRPERRQTPGEELANSISHGVGLLAALVAVPVLIAHCVQEGDAASVVAACLFGASLLALYLMSTLYHALPGSKAKRVFQVLDHCSIFLLIAGTYTPFTLGALRGSWGWSLFGVVWSLAVLGILTKVFFSARGGWISTFLYLAMGWLIIVAMKPMLEGIPPAGIAWLAAGGLAYTAGVVFYLLSRRIPYAHFGWHLFVVAGSVSHFIAVFRYAA